MNILDKYSVYIPSHLFLDSLFSVLFFSSFSIPFTDDFFSFFLIPPFFLFFRR